MENVRAHGAAGTAGDGQENLNLSQQQPALGLATEHSALPGSVLAYLGDAVYELEIRRLLLKKGHHKGKNLHKEATRRVNAGIQNKLIMQLMDDLSEAEKDIFRRGRNAKPKYIPKQSNINEYTNASGLEALMGWLFLEGNQARIQEIIGHLEKIIENEERGL